MSTSNDGRQYAPATERNREAILQVLQRVLPPNGTVLEVGSGTGEHAIFFTSWLYPRKWLPSDPNPLARDSIAAWQAYSPVENLYPPLDLDVHSKVWPIEVDGQLKSYDISAIVSINMIHIAPWSACLGLIAGASRILPKGGMLYLYGPFKQGGQHTAPSNAAFDEMLESQNPEWGVRNLDDVIAVAKEKKLRCREIVQMPANNLSVVFQRK